MTLVCALLFYEETGYSTRTWHAALTETERIEYMKQCDSKMETPKRGSSRGEFGTHQSADSPSTIRRDSSGVLYLPTHVSVFLCSHSVLGNVHDK